MAQRKQAQRSKGMPPAMSTAQAIDAAVRSLRDARDALAADVERLRAEADEAEETISQLDNAIQAMGGEL